MPKNRRLRSRLISHFLVIAIACLSTNSLALEVSDLTLLSKLGQPLLAQLTILQPQPVNEQELTISQAPAAVYQQMGIDSIALYQQLKFTLSDKGLVTITSIKPIKEPFLNLVLQFRWPEGELNREFTLLLDPS